MCGHRGHFTTSCAFSIKWCINKSINGAKSCIGAGPGPDFIPWLTLYFPISLNILKCISAMTRIECYFDDVQTFYYGLGSLNLHINHPVPRRDSRKPDWISTKSSKSQIWNSNNTVPPEGGTEQFLRKVCINNHKIIRREWCPWQRQRSP